MALNLYIWVEVNLCGRSTPLEHIDEVLMNRSASCDNNIRHLSRKALAIQDGETQYSEHSFSECELVNAFVGTTTTGFAISLPQAFKHFRTYGQKIHTYPKILREYLNRVTLEQFGVPWEADPVSRSACEHMKVG